MSTRVLWEEISQGPLQGVIRGRKGNVGENNRTCKMDMRQELILMKDFHKGNGKCRTSPNGLDVGIGYKSWRICESRLMTLKLS